MAPIGPGRLVWEVDPGARGGGKLRPFVIVTRAVDYVRHKPVFAIGCSTSFPGPTPENEVRLPVPASPGTGTQLTEPTVAVVDWLVQFPPDSPFPNRGGRVPADLLREICQRAGLVFPSER